MYLRTHSALRYCWHMAESRKAHLHGLLPLEHLSEDITEFIQVIKSRSVRVELLLRGMLGSK